MDKIIRFILPVLLFLLIGGAIFLMFVQGVDAEDLFTDYAIPASIYLTIGGVVIAALASVISTLFSLIYNPAGTIKSLVGVIVFVGLLFVLWSMAPSEITGIFKAAKYSHIGPSEMKMVSAGISSAMVLAGGAVVIAIVMEFVNAFR